MRSLNKTMDINQRNNNEKSFKLEGGKRVLQRHIVYISTILSVIWILNISGIGCPVRFFFGIRCPSCGMTRAILALLRLEFQKSLEYNLMTIPVVFALFLGFHKRLIRRKGLADILIITVAVITFFYYLYNLIII